MSALKYCNICTYNFSNIRRHRKSQAHQYLSNKIVNRYFVENIAVYEISSVVNRYCKDYKTKFNNFDCYVYVKNKRFDFNFQIQKKYNEKT